MAFIGGIILLVAFIATVCQCGPVALLLPFIVIGALIVLCCMKR